MEKLRDYISGLEIKATPEEVEAVQVFSKQLVEDYCYSKQQIQTRPQFKLNSCQPDIKKEYLVDIAVFKNEHKNEDDIYIIVECKKKNRKDGRSQLEDYLRFSKATLGVWFNGEQRLFLRKYEKEGKVYFDEIPNIPLNGQRIEDIGKFKKIDLKPTHNLKAIFKSIRNHLAANNVGATRDEVLAQQLINMIFCKLYDEKYTAPNEMVKFRVGIEETHKDVTDRILEIFNEVREKQPEIFDYQDKLSLDSNSIVYVVGELQNYSLMNSERDVVADAFETFIGHALKGGQGQFFTPRNIVKMMVEILQPTETDKIIDPACGSAGFLIDTLKYVWETIDTNYKKLAWKDTEIEKKKIDVATNNFRGIDKDYFLSKVAKAYMNLVGDGTTGIFCEDSLENPKNWRQETQFKIKLESFDVILTNPPFGKSIPVKGTEKLKQFDLGYKWKDKDNYFVKDKLKDNESPEILFIERCLQLLKPNGRLGIVLPDGIFNETASYIRSWLLKRVKIIAIIDICKEVFMPNTSTKTSILFFEKTEKPIKEDYDIFMAVAYFCGHDRRGKEIQKNDIPLIINQYKNWAAYKKLDISKNVFTARLSELIQSNFWIPKHFSPYYKQAFDIFKNQYKIIKLGEIATFKKGDEPGSANYVEFIDRKETDVPFIRTGDLVNSVVNHVPDIFLDEEMYKQLNQNLLPKDILFTKDGKIGIVAMVTENDKVVIASGLLRIRITKDAKTKYGISPEYVYALLSNKFTGYFQALRSTVIAATIPHLRTKRIEEFDIPILEQTIINQITTTVQNSFELKNNIKKLDIEIEQMLKNKINSDFV